jgi:hypothetical protein
MKSEAPDLVKDYLIRRELIKFSALDIIGIAFKTLS